jgi:DNA-binding NarL/FixJ family response regulator
MTDPAANDFDAGLLIIAESLLSRAGLRALLDERGCYVLDQVDGADLQRDLERLAPDLLVVDLGWDAEQMRERLARIERDVPLLALAADSDNESLAPLLGILRAFPCFALLLRDNSADAIVAALAALVEGLTVLDPRLIASLGAAMPVANPPLSNPLTARENEVLQLLARGLTNRAIAHELGITQHTVKFHVNAIMGKLDAQSRTEAVVRASQLGMIVL